MKERILLKEAEDLLSLAEKSADREAVYARTRVFLSGLRLGAIGIFASLLLTLFLVHQTIPFVVPSLLFLGLILFDTSRFERKILRKMLLHRLARAEATLILWETKPLWFTTESGLKGAILEFRLGEFNVLDPEAVRLQLNRLK
jgi:hypothetical protein